MKATLLYRIAAVIFVLFAAGHTVGFLTFRAPSPEGVAVFDAMNNVPFSEGSFSYSYGKFYRGFGLSCTVSMLFSSFIAWHLGSLAAKLPQAIGALGWIFCAVQVVGAYFSWKYFGPPPMVFSLALAALLAVAAWLAGKPQSAAQH